MHLNITPIVVNVTKIGLLQLQHYQHSQQFQHLTAAIAAAIFYRHRRRDAKESPYGDLLISVVFGRRLRHASTLQKSAYKQAEGITILICKRPLGGFIHLAKG